MEYKNKKCSFEEHKEVDAICYCHNCNVNLCNKCDNFHDKLCKAHKTYKFDKDNQEIFTGYCPENHHTDILNFFCKNHNKLCCSGCLCKLKTNNYGQHKDCDVYIIEDIKEEKKIKLKENIKKLENLSNNINDSISKIKIIYEKINKHKEELKIKIQGIFTKIRNALNDREDELLLEVNQNYDKIYFKEELIKECEKLPNKIKISLAKGKLIDKEWDNNNILNSIINDCINIENNINKINLINDSIKNYSNFNDSETKLYIEDENEIKIFLEMIKKFGKINKSSNLKNSLIITQQEEVELINSWISPNKKFNYQLIYRATRDGDSDKEFHSKCDNKSPILVIGKTPKGYIFGGYTTINIDYDKCKDKDIYLSDNEAFVFSLNQKKKFVSNDKEKAIKLVNGYCIIFGNGSNSLQIENKILTSKEHWSNPNGSYGSNLNLTESNNFSIIELEVFHINFEI